MRIYPTSAAARPLASGFAAIGWSSARAANCATFPQAVRALGEELVLFRDDRGRIGLLGLHCPHRGTSLEYGDIEDGGIRCPYHGWLFDVDGQCLAMPAEPAERGFAGKVRHLSYPVQEQGGLLFAFLGPEAETPPLPRYLPLVSTDGQRSLEATRLYNYNWFNFIENGADPAHFYKPQPLTPKAPAQ